MPIDTSVAEHVDREHPGEERGDPRR